MRTLLISCLFVLGCCGSECSAQVVRLRVEGSQTVGSGTAFCIGETTEGRSVLLTAKHNFRSGQLARVYYYGSWHDVSNVNHHPIEDVTSFEANVKLPSLELAESEQVGALVQIPGFGPEYQGREASTFSGVMQTGYVAGERGLHPIPGDSGAPVIQQDKVVGVIFGYNKPVYHTTHRSDFAEHRLPTRYTGLPEIRECLQQCYPSSQCGPNGCRIWIRNEYRQPIGLFGLPAGPPQRVQVAEPVPRTYVPEDQSQPAQPVYQQPQASTVRGPAGPQGPPGRDGRSITAEEVETIVNAWLDANRDSLVGPQGPAGTAGTSADITHIEARVTTLEQRPFRIILSADGKVVDDETYSPGEPVVLDLKRFRSVSGDN